MNKTLRIASATVLLVTALGAGTWYWIQSGKVRSTDNAYVNADIVQIASQLTGPVAKLYVHEGQRVSAGAPLFDIDPAPFEVAVSLAEAKVQEAAQGVHQGNSDVQAAAAALSQAEAERASAAAFAQRTQSLVQAKFLSGQAFDDAQARVRVADAAVLAARAKLAGAKAHVAPVGDATPSVQVERAALEQARLNLAHTHVVASRDGWITHLDLVEGSTVNAGAPLFALVASNSFRIDANFKETELPGIQPGQRTSVEIDMLPDQLFEGVVDSIGNGTGAAFSLLPAQNATGNWVKVTQRVPVRIRFSNPSALPALRVGATAKVSVRLDP